MKGTPLDVDPVFHKDFLFYGIDPDVRQKLMDELKGSGVDAETGSKRKRQAKGRTNFEISATAIRSKYSKHGNHFNAGDLISIAKIRRSSHLSFAVKIESKMGWIRGVETVVESCTVLLFVGVRKVGTEWDR